MGELYDTQRKNLKRRIPKSLRTDREHWWVSKARELERADTIGNQRPVFQLIRQTGWRKILSVKLSQRKLIHVSRIDIDSWSGEQNTSQNCLVGLRRYYFWK